MIKKYINHVETKILKEDDSIIYYNISKYVVLNIIISIFTSIIIVPILIVILNISIIPYFFIKPLYLIYKIRTRKVIHSKIRKRIEDYSKVVTEENGYMYFNKFSDTFFLPHNKKRFLQLFFSSYNNHYDTFNKNGKCCSCGRRRSLGDIYLITKYYYPDTSIFEVLNILNTLLKEGELHASYCNTINKMVYYIPMLGRNKLNDKTEYTDLLSVELNEKITYDNYILNKF